jgi:transcriptional regulator with XRE-family HTH domain
MDQKLASHQVGLGGQNPQSAGSSIRRACSKNIGVEPTSSSPTPATAEVFGQTFKRVRLLRGLKQSHTAELFQVTQTTVSRWERGELVPSPKRAGDILRRLRASAGPDPDGGLRRLVRNAHRPCHLICDSTHRFLAASLSRLSEWGRAESELIDVSLWDFATDEIRAAESRLQEIGWYDSISPAVLTYTGEQCTRGLHFKAGFLLWEQIRLGDGSRARIVTSGALDELIKDVPHVTCLATEPSRKMPAKALTV